MADTEREFLHAISNTLAIAIGMVDFGISAMEKPNLTGEDLAKVKTRLEKAQAALVRTTDLLKARREVLIKATPSS